MERARRHGRLLSVEAALLHGVDTLCEAVDAGAAHCRRAHYGPVFCREALR